jgi:EpsD family peptidyl-prolyl cis-trans isomerase
MGGVSNGGTLMKVQFAVGLAMAACLGLGACGNGEPKGQVVAKVGKDEITVLDLQAALANFKAPDAKSRKIAEQQALGAIVQRKILAQAAHKQKIDKTPEYARLQEQTNEQLLVRTWQEQLVKAVPAPSAEDAQKFVNEHPDLYGARKKFAVEALRFNLPNDPTLGAALQPLHTLDEVRALLTARKIPFANGETEIDALAVDPKFVEQLMRIKSDDVFAVPQNGVVLVGHIVSIREEPVPNALALRHATNYLRQTRVQEAVSRRFGGIVAAGMKDVKFAKGYEPPKAAPAAAKAPAAATKPAAASAAAAAKTN